MMKKTALIPAETGAILQQMGRQIRLARLRRKKTARDIATCAGISRQTLAAIENGCSTVSVGAYAAVLHILDNMDADFLLVAKVDENGRMLQDLALEKHR